MSKELDLLGDEAVAKVRELVDSTATCMFGTGMHQIPTRFVPMGAVDVDDEGAVWFFSGADSDHNQDLNIDPRTQLVFAKPTDVAFMTLFGTTEIVNDKAKVDELWKPMFNAWFPEGKDDPNLTLLRVKPEQGHYWNTKDGKVVSMAKILFSAVAGGYRDGSVEGSLRP